VEVEGIELTKKDSVSSYSIIKSSICGLLDSL
jgi:hypothetical protein